MKIWLAILFGLILPKGKISEFFRRKYQVYFFCLSSVSILRGHDATDLTEITFAEATSVAAAATEKFGVRLCAPEKRRGFLTVAELAASLADQIPA